MIRTKLDQVSTKAAKLCRKNAQEQPLDHIFSSGALEITALVPPVVLAVPSARRRVGPFGRASALAPHKTVCLVPSTVVPNAAARGYSALAATGGFVHAMHASPTI